MIGRRGYLHSLEPAGAARQTDSRSKLIVRISKW